MTTTLCWSNKQKYGFSNKHTKMAILSWIQLNTRHNRCSPEKQVKWTPPFWQHGCWTIISPKYPRKDILLLFTYAEQVLSMIVYAICLAIWNVSLLVTLLKMERNFNWHSLWLLTSCVITCTAFSSSLFPYLPPNPNWEACIDLEIM